MSLDQQLVDQPPRDSSGSRASDRFEYQKNWALCELLLLHLSGNDYVITFDHHEDVSVLDREQNPSEFRGYQIKTKSSGTWTLKALIKRDEGVNTSLSSILGKLCSSLKKFPNSVRLLQIVSNASYKVKVKPDNKPDPSLKLIPFVEMGDDAKKEILEALKAELDLDATQSLPGILELRVSELSLDDHATHARGKLVDALDKLFPGQNFPVSAVYRAIIGEINARNNNSETIDSYESYLRKKSLSRSRFTSILTECGVARTVAQWASAEQRLNSESVPVPEIRAFEKEWDGVLLDRLERRGDIIYVRMHQAVVVAVEGAKSAGTLVEILNTAMETLARKPDWPYSDNYLKTCILVQLYES